MRTNSAKFGSSSSHYARKLMIPKKLEEEGFRIRFVSGTGLLKKKWHVASRFRPQFHYGTIGKLWRCTLSLLLLMLSLGNRSRRTVIATFNLSRK